MDRQDLALKVVPPKPEPVDRPLKPLTLRRFTGLLALWLVGVLMFPLALGLGALTGAIAGAGAGVYRQLEAMRKDVARWWRQYEAS